MSEVLLNSVAIVICVVATMILVGVDMSVLVERVQQVERRVVNRVGGPQAEDLPTPPVRPIEQIAHDALRLGLKFRQPSAGLRFARYEALRRAYDDVLVEGCAALGIEHLMGVLPPGPELDMERRRVERRLADAGLDLDQAA